MGSLIQIVLLLLDVLWYFILAQIIMSWLISFGVLNSRQQLVITIWRSLEGILEPLYSRIRKIIPPINGGLDLAPLILLVAVYALRVIIRNNFTF